MSLSDLEYLAEVRKELIHRGLVDDFESHYYNFANPVDEDGNEKENAPDFDARMEEWKNFTQSNDIVVLDTYGFKYGEDYQDVLDKVVGHVVYVDKVPMDEFTLFLFKDLGNVKNPIEITPEMGSLDGFIE